MKTRFLVTLLGAGALTVLSDGVMAHGGQYRGPMDVVPPSPGGSGRPGNPTGPAVLLPSQDWGFPLVTVPLGTDFDGVDSVQFFVTNPVDCFGMDNFYIDEIPAPSAAGLLSVSGLLLAGRRRR